MPDLWPADIGTTVATPPVTLLKEQPPAKTSESALVTERRPLDSRGGTHDRPRTLIFWRVIVKEQATFLGEKTRHLVVGEVAAIGPLLVASRPTSGTLSTWLDRARKLPLQTPRHCVPASVLPADDIR